MMALSFTAVGRSGLVLLSALALAGCFGQGSGGPQMAAPPAASADPNQALTQPGTEEDFMVNVGRRTYFSAGSATLDATAKVTLEKQAAWLNQYPQWPVKIQGFADDPGSAKENLQLSQRRAEAVRDHLVSLGVSPDRISVKGYGRDRLVRECADIACTSQNRRVITNLQDEPVS
ncbi:OmpA family protein [Rhodoligotrophos defluvii]|uniref:OmpA family protein n=1 Tax=Rhodoligotrophos defluvii TaxID=2561934 RepID=UPI0010C9FAB7|nr:OmpA family protein [Rhodoligotrophos defluvii]